MGIIYVSRCCPECNKPFAKESKQFIQECEDNICKDCKEKE